MVLVASGKSKYGGKCARDGCQVEVKVNEPYIFDTEARKAYCSKECAEMATNQKVVENTGKSNGPRTFQKINQQLWRTPEEALSASTIWHQTVIPMIFDTTKKLQPSAVDSKSQQIDKEIFYKVAQLYEEIFLGKMQGGSKGV